MMDGRPPQKSRSVTVLFVTLQRDPPLTRIFAPGRAAPSRRATPVDRRDRPVKMAVAIPAAPAPTIATSNDSDDVRGRSLQRRRVGGRQFRSGARGASNEQHFQVGALAHDLCFVASALGAQRVVGSVRRSWSLGYTSMFVYLVHVVYCQLLMGVFTVRSPLEHVYPRRDTACKNCNRKMTDTHVVARQLFLSFILLAAFAAHIPAQPVAPQKPLARVAIKAGKLLDVRT
jgi:hypothetical protein